jgi:GNAT superfamily N-acetyltransferase
MSDAAERAWLGQWLAAIRASEQLAIDAVCNTTVHAGYTVFRSDRFPNFYGGNGLRITGPTLQQTPAAWVEVFHQHFEPSRYRHVTIVVPGALWTAEVEREAVQAGLGVYRETYMAVRAGTLAREAGRGGPIVEPALLSTRDAAAGLYQLHLEESRDEDWFTDEAGFRALFDKTLAIAEGTHTTWLAAPDPARAGRYAAALGFFPCAGIHRLQEVITAPAWRRRGLATSLLGAAGRRAQEAGSAVVALAADPDGDAYRLYRRLGFVDLACDVTLMRY